MMTFQSTMLGFLCHSLVLACHGCASVLLKLAGLVSWSVYLHALLAIAAFIS